MNKHLMTGGWKFYDHSHSAGAVPVVVDRYASETNEGETRPADLCRALLPGTDHAFAVHTPIPDAYPAA